MYQYATAGQLAAYVKMSTNNNVQPCPEAIHELLKDNGLIPQVKHYNGSTVKLYNVQNAKRVIAQKIMVLKAINDHISAWKRDAKNNPKPEVNKQHFVPRRTGESNASLELLRQDN
jgi:hypothetical protein